MKSLLLILVALLSFSFLFSQNVGIGTTTPTEKLDVNGNVRANGLFTGIVSTSITYTYGLVLIGSQNSDGDFLMADAGGQVGFRKGHGGIGLRYIIALGGTDPSQSGSALYNVTLRGEIKLFAGVNAPSGWAFCEGQLLAISSNPDLFVVLGTTYGGDGENVFALPDLRNRVAVDAPGSPWMQGDTSD